jgi:hypothetical protein
MIYEAGKVILELAKALFSAKGAIEQSRSKSGND